MKDETQGFLSPQNIDLRELLRFGREPTDALGRKEVLGLEEVNERTTFGEKLLQQAAPRIFLLWENSD